MPLVKIISHTHLWILWLEFNNRLYPSDYCWPGPMLQKRKVCKNGVHKKSHTVLSSDEDRGVVAAKAPEYKLKVQKGYILYTLLPPISMSTLQNGFVSFIAWVRSFILAEAWSALNLPRGRQPAPLRSLRRKAGTPQGGQGPWTYHI